jgi:hypothetical protein
MDIVCAGASNSSSNTFLHRIGHCRVDGTSPSTLRVQRGTETGFLVPGSYVLVCNTCVEVLAVDSWPRSDTDLAVTVVVPGTAMAATPTLGHTGLAGSEACAESTFELFLLAVHTPSVHHVWSAAFKSVA